MKKQAFEDNIKKLEEIVNKLELEDLSLDKSISLFSTGIKLVKECGKDLEKAEKQIEILAKDEDGKLTKKPFDLGIE